MPHFNFSEELSFLTGALQQAESEQKGSFTLQIIQQIEETVKKSKLVQTKEVIHAEKNIKVSDVRAMAAANKSIILPVNSSQGKGKGYVKLKKCTVRNFYTFLDLHIRNSLNIVPIIGVDYSLANLTFDERGYCLHSLKPGQPNDYLDVLKLVYESF